jgi:lipase chaperone LimK
MSRYNLDALNKVRKKVDEEPREAIKNLQSAVSERLRAAMGNPERPIEGESLLERRPLVGPDVEARPGFKADQEAMFKKYEDQYAERNMPMEKDEMSPMEKAAILEQLEQAEEMKRNRGPRGL